ncbi:consortin isoform X2 [Cyclopterus lumpus]|uniref:consortin isoform X2 n=1 Tax=Cyclopterus lumpus TaxID=8103 RepID=UPI0014871F68|nr:consortin isoform X2 [Cyclopterus lumpus]
MDHDGELEREDRAMSQVQEEEGGPIQKTSVNNNGKDSEEEHGKEGYTGRGREEEEEEEEEEDIDEVMKGEGEEEEESEESSCLISCQTPETPMTDSSYSETGSLLETPYPFSPATSPEPTSPVIPEMAFPASQMEISQIDVKVDSHNTDVVASITGSFTQGPTFTTGPIDSTTLTLTSVTSPPGPTCITEATGKIAKNTNLTTRHLTSSTEPVFNYEPPCTRGFPSTAETFTVPACTAMPNTSIASTPMSETAHPLTFTTGPTTTGTESNNTTGPINSNWEHISSTPERTCFSVSTCAAGPIPSPALLESLQELAQRGDVTHLPQYLHQIAEAFVLHKDYQRALWCIQLERLYHQRVLDNLNALQEQWESQCRSSFFDLATRHLDTLKNICQTHSRPGARDAVCASLDLLRPTFEEGGALPLCTSVHQIDEGIDQRAQDPSCYESSHPVIPLINLTDGLHSPEISEKDGSDPDREVEGRDCFHGDQLTDKHGSNGEGGEAEGGAEYTISVIGNGLHPSTAGEMDQSKPAEQQGGDLGPTQEKEAKGGEEEREVKEAAEALEMEDEGEEEEEEERQKEKDSALCQKALPVETLASGADVELQQLDLEALAEKKLHEETQESTKTYLLQDARLPQEAHINQQEQQEQSEEVKEEEEEDEEENEEEDEEYDDYDEVEQVDIIKEAPSLDGMAKLITVEQRSPAPGLVSILKRRRVCVDNMSVSASSETQPAKRRVRFKVPDDGYEQDVGGGDSCLLLFLLCLVTVVISVGGTALYCALGDVQSSVCQDFSRNADFYVGQIQSGVAQIQHWFAHGS